MRIAAYLGATLILVATSSVASAADLSLADCNKAICKGVSSLPYTLKRGESCHTILGERRRFHFYSLQQIDALNAKTSKFKCATAKQGQTLCYPKADVGPKC